jgi:hypothetical protein
MFKLNKRFTVGFGVVGITAIALLSPTANAGLEITADTKKSAVSEAKTQPTKIESMARVAKKGPANTFKCWQEGRLIFQRTNLEIAKQKLPGAATIKANGTTVQVLDLKQGVCILDQAVK